MKLQWSLRTLLIVMTLGGPLVAGSWHLSSAITRHLSAYEQVHCGHDVNYGSWTEANREAQALSIRYQREDRRRLQRSTACSADGALQPLVSVD